LRRIIELVIDHRTGRCRRAHKLAASSYTLLFEVAFGARGEDTLVIHREQNRIVFEGTFGMGDLLTWPCSTAPSCTSWVSGFRPGFLCLHSRVRASDARDLLPSNEAAEYPDRVRGSVTPGCEPCQTFSQHELGPFFGARRERQSRPDRYAHIREGWTNAGRDRTD
jgi:hypothetical protein